MQYVNVLLAVPDLTLWLQEMSRMLEINIHRQGLKLPKSATIRRAAVMLPYLQHYAVELAAYAQLAWAPNEWGFFTPEYTILDLSGHTT